MFFNTYIENNKKKRWGSRGSPATAKVRLHTYSF